jgi:hypothetical protein
MTEKAEVFNLTETPTEPTPAIPTPERTDFSMLQEIFEQFPTAKEARKHINDVAAGRNKFNRTFGESSIRKVIAQKCHFKGDAGKIVSHEATAKIGAGNDIPIQQEVTQEATAEPTAPTASPSETPSMPYGSYEAAKAELEPIQERSVKGLVDNVFSIAGLKGEGKDDGEAFLTDQESKDTVTLIPYILKRVTKTDMTQDNYELLTMGLHTANIVSKVAKKRIEKGKLLKKENPATKTEIPNPAQPTPTQEKETPPTEPTEQPNQVATETAPSIDQQTAAFKKRLG